VRGPQGASKIKLSHNQTPSQLGIPYSVSAGTDPTKLSLSRISQATPDLAAYFLKRLNIPKRLPDLECPAWLQFPAAGGIEMPESYRAMHKEFSMKFSEKIGGSFNDGIYQQQHANARLDSSLRLF
jgi:hypothetical protein